MNKSQSNVALRVFELVEPIAASEGAFLIDVVMRNDREGKLLEVFLDAEKGLTTEICTSVSRGLSRILDAEQLIQGRYHLVVSSPGVARGLKDRRQYPQHVGRTLSVHVRTPEGERKLTGSLTKVYDGGILLRVGEEELSFGFDRIIEAKVEVPW